MRDIWTANLVAKMHLYEISYLDLGNKLGVTNHYVGMVLNGLRKPSGAQARFEAAVDEIIKEKAREA